MGKSVLAIIHPSSRPCQKLKNNWKNGEPIGAEPKRQTIRKKRIKVAIKFAIKRILLAISRRWLHLDSLWRNIQKREKTLYLCRNA
jgi:hypothetical protein